MWMMLQPSQSEKFDPWIAVILKESTICWMVLLCLSTCMERSGDGRQVGAAYGGRKPAGLAIANQSISECCMDFGETAYDP